MKTTKEMKQYGIDLVENVDSTEAERFVGLQIAKEASVYMCAKTSEKVLGHMEIHLAICKKYKPECVRTIQDFLNWCN